MVAPQTVPRTIQAPISAPSVATIEDRNASKAGMTKALIASLGAVLVMGAVGAVAHTFGGALIGHLPFHSRYAIQPYDVVFDGSYHLDPGGSDVPMATQDPNDLKIWEQAEPMRSYVNGDLNLQSNGDISTMSDLRSSGRILLIHNDTKAQVIAEQPSGWRQVRVTEGFHAGQTGWVSTFAVRRPDETPMEMQATEQVNPMETAAINQSRESRGLKPYQDNPAKVITGEPLQDPQGRMYYLDGYSQPGGPDIPRPGYTYPCGPDAHQPSNLYPCTPVKGNPLRANDGSIIPNSGVQYAPASK